MSVPPSPYRLISRGQTLSLDDGQRRASTFYPRDIEIDRLLGVSYDKRKERVKILPEKFLDIFASGVSLKKWLKGEVLSVSEYDYDISRVWEPRPGKRLRRGKLYKRWNYTLQDIISLVANKEGGVHLSQKNKDKRDLENMSIGGFGVILYAHIVIFCLSLYLLRQHAISQKHSESYREFLCLPDLDDLRYQDILISIGLTPGSFVSRVF